MPTQTTVGKFKFLVTSSKCQYFMCMQKSHTSLHKSERVKRKAVLVIRTNMENILSLLEIILLDRFTKLPSIFHLKINF